MNTEFHINLLLHLQNHLIDVYSYNSQLEEFVLHYILMGISISYQIRTDMMSISMRGGT